MDSRELIELLTPFNFWRQRPFTGIERPAYLRELDRLAATGQLVLVMGVRRAGKTTILLQYLGRLIDSGQVPASRTLYINLEDPRLPEGEGARLLEDLLVAHRAHVSSEGLKYLILDEVQQIPGWERWVRMQKEARPDLNILITGSSAKLLSRELATLLTGRHLDLEVFPLSLAEFLIFRGLDPTDPLADPEQVRAVTLEYLRSSAFPQAVLMKEPELKERMVQQIYRDLLYHDVVRRHRIRDIDKLEALANQLLASVPGPVTYNGLRRALQGRLSLDSVERFCAYLQEPYLFHFVPTHAYGSAARQRSPRKVYTIDNGLLLACAYHFSLDTGKLLENLVFNDLRRQGLQLFRWVNRRELDFLVWKGARAMALVNVSVELTRPATRTRELEGLSAAMAEFGLSLGWLVTLDHDEIIEVAEGTVKAVSYRRWALEYQNRLVGSGWDQAAATTNAAGDP